MSETLTGNQRYRSEHPLFRRERLVLQVEVEFEGMELLGGFPEHTHYKFWRDAVTTDLPLPNPPNHPIGEQA